MDNSHVYELSSRPLTGPKGQNLGMVVVCRDVTERRNALDKLADNEHLIRTLIETSSNGILRISGEPIGEDFSVTLIDITQRKRNEDKMLADALRDPLTGMLNRRGFEKEGNKAMRVHAMGAVLYLDLNQFKSINDRFGHHAGDALLKAFGHRLEFCLRPRNTSFRDRRSNVRPASVLH